MTCEGKVVEIDDKRYKLTEVECTDSSKFWYQPCKLLEDADGDKAWYLNGTKLTEEELFQKTKTCEGKVVEIDGKRYKLIEVD